MQEEEGGFLRKQESDPQSWDWTSERTRLLGIWSYKKWGHWEGYKIGSGIHGNEAQAQLTTEREPEIGA